MKKRLVILPLAMIAPAIVAAIAMPLDIENVPVERVVANLERQVTERPKDADLRVNLARVHAMAFAEKLDTIPTATARGGKNVTVPWAGGFVPSFRQFEVKPSSDPKVVAAARAHLTKAVARYREALELAPTNLVAKMGLGWTLSEAGDKPGAIAALRDVVAQALPKDRRAPGSCTGTGRSPRKRLAI